MLSTVSVKMANEKIWMERYPNIEMTAGANKEITPGFSFLFSGLEEDKEYIVFLTIERFDNIRYALDEHGEWAKSGKRGARPIHSYKSVRHLSYVQSGKYWMNGPINFDEVRISYKDEEIEGNNSVVFVQTMHKYIPVITITDSNLILQKRVEMDVAQFFPVSTYRHKTIGEWKSKLTVFATLKNGGVGGKRKQNEDDSEKPITKKTKSAESKKFEEKQVLMEKPPTDNHQTNKIDTPNDYGFDEDLLKILQQHQQQLNPQMINNYSHGIMDQWNNYNTYPMVNDYSQFQHPQFYPHHYNFNNSLNPPTIPQSNFPSDVFPPLLNVPQDIHNNENVVPNLSNSFNYPF